jgi:short-subunit dehydrogenase
MNTETALITGASSGIGLHLSHQFAEHGHPVVIIAPDLFELETIANEIQQRYGVTARAIARDLERPEAAQEIFDELQNAGVEVDILANNAGHGFHGRWWEVSGEKDLSMIRLNIEAPLRLTRLFLAPMLSRQRGRILNTASIAAFQPGPLQATYYATKAFLLSWSEALAIELDDTPITVTALCPGVTDTDFFVKGGSEGIRGRQSSNVMAPQEVARIGYEALMNKELFVVAGGMNKAMVAARRVLSVELQAKINEKMNEDVAPEDRTHHRGEKEGQIAMHA